MRIRWSYVHVYYIFTKLLFFHWMSFFNSIIFYRPSKYFRLNSRWRWHSLFFWCACPVFISVSKVFASEMAQYIHVYWSYQSVLYIGTYVPMRVMVVSGISCCILVPLLSYIRCTMSGGPGDGALYDLFHCLWLALIDDTLVPCY